MTCAMTTVVRNADPSTHNARFARPTQVCIKKFATAGPSDDRDSVIHNPND